VEPTPHLHTKFMAKTQTALCPTPPSTTRISPNFSCTYIYLKAAWHYSSKDNFKKLAEESWALWFAPEKGIFSKTCELIHLENTWSYSALLQKHGFLGDLLARFS